MQNASHELNIYSQRIPAVITVLTPGQVQELHWHTEPELIASTDPGLRITVGSQQYTLREQDATVINSMEAHRVFFPKDSSGRAVILDLNSVFLEAFCPNFSHVHLSLKSKPELRRQLVRYMEQICEIYTQEPRDPFYELELNSLLLKIVHILLSQCQVSAPVAKAPSTVKYQQRYRQISAYINAHYAEPLTLKELADLVHISKEHLCREFKVYMGKGLREHLTDVRLSMAHKDLLDTDIPLSELALKHGFPDLRSYNKAFRDRYGIPPAQYRRQQKYQQEN